ncbi:TIGR01777 family oxidoreductase [Promineifilum sp.]|uniref:TIGR01777 family oxidoreductase n=1 Tax=Promineifilum sp. TaxID=2664178 RepID=UPI0035B06F25
MRYIITGGSGFIGSRLSESLVADGHEVIILSRSPAKQSASSGVQVVQWDARTADGWGHLADGAFAIVNLAGETTGGSGVIPLPGTWSDKRKRLIKESRRNAGQAVVAAVAAATVKPQVVVQMSGIDYYPATNTVMTEESGRGRQFLAEVVADYWEPATAAVEEMGVRRVVARTAPLLNLETGPLPASLLQFKLFAGGRLGSGKQWFTWIHTEDAVRALRFLADTEAARGIYNVASPNPVTNADFSKILGRVMGRPSLLPVPEFALKLLLGEVSALVLEGRPVSVRKLETLGFTFRFPMLEAALRDILKR